MINEEERYEHPAYGQIEFSRVSSNAGDEFYGSELKQGHYITMIVSESEHSKSLTSDFYFPKKRILELRMTSNQFSELITSLNMGSGVPCTLEFVDGKKVETIDKRESQKEFVHRKMKDRMNEFAQRLKDGEAKAQELVKKKTLSKADQHELNLIITSMSQEVAGNIPFFMEQFQETMDDVVLDAKKEVESAIQHKVNVLGLGKLHEQNKLLIKE